MHVTQEESRTHSLRTGHGLLEELLTYDDLFLESFNAFLSLPVFPLRLQYDRLTGRLQELDGVFLWESPSQMEVGPHSPLYGATDEERERTLSWLAQERFLPFQRTIFYLEYKLAKLLISPLDENYPVSRYVIRGYSRQSDSTAVSSIPSYISTRRQATGVQSHMLLRLPSQTRSTPACLGRFTSLSGELAIHPSFSSILSLKQSPVEHLSRFQHQLLSDSSIESTREMLSTGWTNAGEPVLSPLHLSRGTAPPSSPDQDFIELHISGNCEKPLSGPRKILQFDLDDTCNSKEDQQDLSLSQEPSFGTSALQQLKEDILGTRAGMESFKEFLHGTLGIHLLDFWIDCEDVMEQIRHLEATVAQRETQMFFLSALRSIQAKYMLTAPLASQEQHGETTGTEETAFAALSRKQYDALRRLRSYWVPRFLIHIQRTSHFQSRLEPNPELQKEEEYFLNADLRFSYNMAGLFSVKGEESDTLSHMKRNDGWRMTQQFRENGRSGIGPNEQSDLPEDPFEKLTTTHFLQALMYDLGDGDGFLHYLTRFEDPEKTHNFLLWRNLKLYESAWEQQSTQSEVHQIALHVLDTFLESYAESNASLSFSMLEYIQHLKTMLSMGNGGLKPSTFEPLVHYVLLVLGSYWLHYVRHDITSFLEYCAPTSHFDSESIGSISHNAKQETDVRIKKERQHSWLHDSQGRGRHKKKGRKKGPPKSYSIDQGTEEKSPAPRDAPTPQNEPDLLSNTIVLKVFRKAAHKMQDVELERILRLLQDMEACQEAAEREKRMDCVKKFLDLCDKPGNGRSNAHLSKELKIRLKEELGQGEISDFSWKEIRLFLHSVVAPGFERFWDEVSQWLKKHGLQEPSQIPEEHWRKLEPLLQSIAARVALERLRSQKGQAGSAAATTQPTREDKASFWQSVKKAAEGWPTIEILHFLKHLQLHGPPVLESGLHFLLEVQKFKNAHHAWPDMALLKKKVQVIRECFLTSPIEPQLQVAVDTKRLGRAIRAAERALQKENPFPPPGLFDELKDSVFSILLPYWAAFQKQWLKRSPTSAQKAPVLRHQLLLQKRKAMFEVPQKTPPSLRLPPLQQPKRGPGSSCQDGLTYAFSLSKGLTLQYSSRESTTFSKTSSYVFGNRKRSTGFQYPSFRNVPVLI